MSTLKMFFCVVSEERQADITIHRELNSIYNLWNNESSDFKVGIIHIGFVRPKFPSYEEIQHFQGKMLVSASAKWSLPEKYNTSNNAVIESCKIPFYQLLTGFGYNIEPTDTVDRLTEESSIENDLALDSKHTIVSAALEVLESLAKPLSKEEIYGHIIERDLFQFGAKKPINILNVELNRHCEGAKYSRASSEWLFGKTEEGLFFALSRGQMELKDWLTEFPSSNPELAEICLNFGIYDEQSYFKKKQLLSDIQVRELELFRYHQLKNLINIEDPSELISILPASILKVHISQLGLTARTSNVFSGQNISTLSDAVDYSLLDMMKWPNFGKKSVRELCKTLIHSVDRLIFQLPSDSNEKDSMGYIDEMSNGNFSADSALDYVSKTPLKKHFENSLSLLKNRTRQVLEYRTGYSEPVKTLEEVGQIIGVTRERVRQIQKKNINKIKSTEYWDDCIAIKIGTLLSNREQPLYLEMLEIEDDWFAGYMGNYQHLAATIELFSENEIRLLTVNGGVAISRVCQDDWDNLVNRLKKSLKNKAKTKKWTRNDVNLTFKASLESKGALELLPILWDIFSSSLQFSSQNQLLIAYGTSGESAVYTVLHQAEKPLHFTEIAKRASKVLGREVEVRVAHSATARQGGKLFARGVYGLAHFNPISDKMCEHIRVVIEKTMCEGSLSKQWHVTELLNSLKKKYPSLPEELDIYILNIILEESDKLTYLNKNVWARADSGQAPGDRVDMADAFTKILEDAGKPLKGTELKSRLQAIRGVHDSLQLQPTDKMIQVGPDFWGLVERDIKGTEENNHVRLDILYDILKNSQKGIHVTEVEQLLNSQHFDDDGPSDYALLNLAQREKRFYLGRSMFLGLSEWGGDTRRLNISQAVREVLSDMDKPMSISEITAKVELLTGLEVDGSVTGLLINEGSRYNSTTKLWEKDL